MPIYMDYHIMDDITIENVKQAHIIDKKIQDKYNVRYLQSWVNEKAGTTFCLIEGPNPEACVQVHREAHGEVACNIVEVEKGLIDVIMEADHKINHGIVYYNNGELDSGFRFIMVIDITMKTTMINNQNLVNIELPTNSRKTAIKKIHKFNGKEFKTLSDDSIIAVFNNPNAALKCASEIQKELSLKLFKKKWNLEFKIGLNEGQPVSKHSGFFEDAIDFCKHLSLIAKNKEIIISKSIEKLSDFDAIFADNKNFKVINSKQEKFIKNFFKYTNSNISNNAFNINRLSQNIGISRPQLYRKIVSITGRSPINFIRDVKMHRALSLINERKLNISQIALEVGYNNPSYFSKCFHAKYGINPSKI